MKKFLGILTIAVALVACDNSASSEQRTKDSTDSVRRVDSINNLTPAPATFDTTNKMSTDTGSKMSSDTTKKP